MCFSINRYLSLQLPVQLPGTTISQSALLFILPTAMQNPHVGVSGSGAMFPGPVLVTRLFSVGYPDTER